MFTDAELFACAPRRLAALAAGLAGLTGTVLLARLAWRIHPRYADMLGTLPGRLERLPAAGLNIWPLLALIGWGVWLSASPAWSGRVPPPTPAPAQVIVSALLQQSLLLLLLAVCLFQARLRWRDLLGNAAARMPARQAAGAGLRGGMMMLLPVWLLSGLGGLALRRLNWPQPRQEAFQWLADAQFGLVPKIALLMIAVLLAPAIEELLFRGVLLPALARGSGHPARALLVVALLFAGLHLHAPTLLPLFGIGVACSLGFLATGHLLTPIVMHAGFNAVSLLVFYAVGG